MASLAPEDRHRADELVSVGEERERRRRDLTGDAVDARDPEPLVCRPPLGERDSGRPPLERQRWSGGDPLVPPGSALLANGSVLRPSQEPAAVPASAAARDAVQLERPRFSRYCWW